LSNGRSHLPRTLKLYRNTTLVRPLPTSSNRHDPANDCSTLGPRVIRTATTRGGGTFRHREAVNRGNGERPLSEAAIIEKFYANAARAVSHDRARQVETLLLSLDEAGDVRTVADKLGSE